MTLVPVMKVGSSNILIPQPSNDGPVTESSPAENEAVRTETGTPVDQTEATPAELTMPPDQIPQNTEASAIEPEPSPSVSIHLNAWQKIGGL